MKTVEAFELEIGYQLEELPRLAGELAPNKLSLEDQEKTVITGAGDSFAAAMIAESASGNMVRCIDPLDICSNPSTVKNRILYAVSISGSTKTNVEAAEAARSIASRRVAITSRKDSLLAKACDEVIELRFRNAGILTAGSIGFTASMLTCLSLVQDVKIKNPGRLFESARNDVGQITLGNEAYIVGSGITYPLAVYGCAKLFEVLGIKARPARLEQFSHMEIFSIRKNDVILILSGDRRAKQLSSKLKAAGYDALVLGPKGGTLEEEAFYYAFLLQMVALQHAKRMKLEECYFVTNDKLRKISSSMIY